MLVTRKKVFAAVVAAQTALVMAVVTATPALAGGYKTGGYHAEKANADIVDVAVANGNFNTLAAALQAAGLVDTLKSDGPFTVFAPTDAAFAKLPAGTVETLLKPENKDKLAAILTYHVVSGKVMAKDVMTLKEAKTVQGGMVNVSMEADTVMIDNAKVVQADIECSNGVIHVIDTVIMPK
mgnify:CR=1 FL=1